MIFLHLTLDLGYSCKQESAAFWPMEHNIYLHIIEQIWEAYEVWRH
jgi:hypothetical protein